MKLILLLALLFSGCGARERAQDIFYRDVMRTLEIATKYGNEPMAACAGFLMTQIEWSHQVASEETAGIVSRAFVAYLAAVEAKGDEERVEDACAPLVGKIAIKALRNGDGK
jgi:hypothetical protein